MNCGGVEQQYERWGGRCGTCGDEWGLPRPRPHETGGTFGQGIFGRNYSLGQVGVAPETHPREMDGTFGQGIIGRNYSQGQVGVAPVGTSGVCPAPVPTRRVGHLDRGSSAEITPKGR